MVLVWFGDVRQKYLRNFVLEKLMLKAVGFKPLRNWKEALLGYLEKI